MLTYPSLCPACEDEKARWLNGEDFEFKWYKPSGDRLQRDVEAPVRGADDVATGDLSDSQIPRSRRRAVSS